jgi:hypothetical protein
VQISNKSMEQCDRFLASFGMSPSARARMTAAAELTQSDLFTGTGHAKPSLAAFATRK